MGGIVGLMVVVVADVDFVTGTDAIASTLPLIHLHQLPGHRMYQFHCMCQSLHRDLHYCALMLPPIRVFWEFLMIGIKFYEVFW